MGFDVTQSITYKKCTQWYGDVTRVCPVLKRADRIVLCGNKADTPLHDRQVKPKNVTMKRKEGLKYVELSCKTTYNYAKPFLILAGGVMEQKGLKFTEEEAELPASPEDVHVREMMKEAEKEYENACNAPLPDEDDETLR